MHWLARELNAEEPLGKVLDEAFRGRSPAWPEGFGRTRADIASLFRHPDLGYQGQVSRARAKTGETRRASIKQE
jgi:hypothetical protein